MTNIKDNQINNINTTAINIVINTCNHKKPDLSKCVTLFEITEQDMINCIQNKTARCEFIKNGICTCEKATQLNIYNEYLRYRSINSIEECDIAINKNRKDKEYGQE